jgi:hypothetical protein
VPSPQQLEIAAQSLIAVLGVWLGLTVATRSRTLPARRFSVLSLALVVWSCAIILQRLSTAADAVLVGRRIEELSRGDRPATAHLPSPSRRRAIQPPGVGASSRLPTS